MNKPILAVGAAAALTVSAVVAPAATAAPSAAELTELVYLVDDLSSLADDAEDLSSDTGSSGISDEARTGLTVTLAILGLIGGGAYFAVTNGFVTLPDEIAQAGYNMGIPGVYPNRGSCHPSEFDKRVKGWPGVLGTSVGYCDGLFATAAANGTDWVVHFVYQKGQWRIIEPDGSNWPSYYNCYNGYKLSEMGASEEFKRGVLMCKPDEIGR